MSEILEIIGLVAIIWLGVILIVGLYLWIKDFIVEHRLAYNKGYKDGLHGYYSCIGCVYPNSSLCDKCKRNYEDMYTVIKNESNSC